MFDRALRPVGIEQLEPETEREQPVLDRGEGGSGRCGEDRMGVPVTVDRPADEVVVGGVAQIDHEVRDHLVEIDESVRQGRALRSAVVRCGGGRDRRRGEEGHQRLPGHGRGTPWRPAAPTRPVPRPRGGALLVPTIARDPRPVIGAGAA